jgi:hypothetical protein
MKARVDERQPRRGSAELRKSVPLRAKRAAPATAPIAGSFRIGRQAFAAISAIEGLYLTAEMEQIFREFDRMELSAEERRQLIIAKYCK